MSWAGSAVIPTGPSAGPDHQPRRGDHHRQPDAGPCGRRGLCGRAPEELAQFSDVVKAHWAYYQIVEATNAHEYTKDNNTESWTELV